MKHLILSIAIALGTVITVGCSSVPHTVQYKVRFGKDAVLKQDKYTAPRRCHFKNRSDAEEFVELLTRAYQLAESKVIATITPRGQK